MSKPRATVNNDIEKLRAAQTACDRLPDGADKDALVFAVLQWMNAAFISDEPLTEKERAFALKVVERLNQERRYIPTDFDKGEEH